MRDRTPRLARSVGLGVLVLLVWVPTVQVPVLAQSSVCDYYVDNSVGSDGNGSWSRPWSNIDRHVRELDPGDTLCVRGSSGSSSARVYEIRELAIDRASGAVKDGNPGNPITVRSYPGERVILRNVGSNDDSVLRFDGADHWVFEGFEMDNGGRSEPAIRFSGGASYNVLRNNEIWNGESSGVVFRAGPSVGNRIENNHIHDFDAGDDDAHCITLEPGSRGTVIRGNTIHDCSGDGIQFYAVDSTPTTDYCSDVQIIDNLFYRGDLQRSEDGIDIKGARGLVVSGNEFRGYVSDDKWSGEGRAIVLQKGGRDLVLEGNVIHHGTSGINIHTEAGKKMEQVTIQNNLLYEIDGAYVIYLNGVEGAEIYHNTIARSAAHSFLIAGDGLSDADIRNNLVYDSDDASIGSGARFDNVTIGHNGWFKASSDFRASSDRRGSGDPGFADVGKHDYHLTGDSAVYDAGTDVGVSVDLDGDQRPAGARPDIGADEVTSGQVSVLRLRADVYDHEIHLSWNKLTSPVPDAYVLTYTYGNGGTVASQGASPLSNIPATANTFRLTGVANYVLYTLSITARFSDGSEQVKSNSVTVIPTDIFVHLPLVDK